MKKIKERNNLFIKEMGQNELLTNKDKNVCTTPNFIEFFFHLVFEIIACITTSDFASLIDISKGIG